MNNILRINYQNTSHKSNEKLSISSMFIALIFLVMPIAYESSASDLLIIGTILFSFLFLMAFFLNEKSLSWSLNLPKTKTIFSCFFILLMFLVCVLLVRTTTFDSFKRVIQIFGCFLIFTVSSILKFTEQDLKLMRYLVYLILTICFFVWVKDGFRFSDYSFYLTNPNTFASLLVSWFCVLLISKRTFSPINLFFVALSVVFAFATSSRTALLALLIFLIFKILLALRKRGHISSKRMVLVFLLELSILTAFVYLYSSLYGTRNGYILQELSRDIFGKNFFSGREMIWQQLINVIKTNPIFGFGLDSMPSNFIVGTHISSHNLFIQTGIQSGLIGMLLLVLTLFSIFLCCVKSNNYLSRTISIFILVIVFHEFFEVTLTQNMIVGGFCMWFLMGLGCNRFLGKKYEQV